MGNSEVGHLNIGAGRVVMQDLPRIDDAIADGEIAKAPALIELIERLRQTGGTCHLMGLVSPGGVHSHQDHAVALAKILAEAGVPTVVHAFTDGRDTPPRSAGRGPRAPERRAAAVGADRHGVRPLLRDGPRQALGARRQGLQRHRARARAPRFPDAAAGDRGRLCARRHRRVRAAGRRSATIAACSDGDGVLCFNFRADRVREILAALLDPAFAGFPRARESSRSPRPSA